MTMLVIDVSRNSIRQSFSDKGIVGTVQHVLWFRIFRPLLVISIWGLLGLYVGYSISSVGPSGLPFEQLRLYGDIIAGMGGVLLMWMILSRLDRAIRRKMASAPLSSLSSPSRSTASRAALGGDGAPSWQRPRNTRLLVVDHDEDGGITRVRGWHEWVGRPAPAGTATPSAPFTRGSEYDPEEPTLSGGAIIVIDAHTGRTEPSLARALPPVMPAQTVREAEAVTGAKTVTAVTADAAGFHRFGYRGKIGRTDWQDPEPVGFGMHPGMSRYYGGVRAVAHGRPVTVAMRPAACSQHAFGAHAQLVDPYADLRRQVRVDPLHGFGRRADVMAEDA
ncbi:poly-beta-1,6-N-acetyl-D-glucosamine biosynthesis protein PgaD [Ralstonia solanacearum]|uniref:poly-beta-1,6-N-acetyl-D-glucosamine biosynthesis protein PgaD n=1 Tax=Ralstonia solanacearum TaxID=305 RepID=UPI000BE777D7|nr:poly-beta-1,6-N-acetyl-D-glucosamine biosynthesis protein PgaD [Ralstonia solanacearum]ATJ87966.1 poly-beta-1,6-N-acetyl-D-glucosamine biosynthesis protein PgaD [Ralstonia solanacearum]